MFDRLSKDNQPLGPQKGDNPSVSPDHQDVTIQTIPSIFYGGADPNIYKEHKEEQSVVHNTDKKKAPKKKEPEKQPAAPTPVAARPVHTIEKPKQAPPAPKSATAPQHPPRSRKKFVFLGVLIFFFLFVIISVYIVWSSGLLNRDTSQVVRPVPPVSDTRDPVPVPPADTDPSTEPENEPDDPVEEEPLPSSQDGVIFPRLVIVQPNDLDFDDLTDEEEALFGTDVGVPDQDNDGYIDGLEVVNLYHPGEFAPARLIDSALVREYIHPIVGYRLYYPSAWASSAVDTEATQVLFSSITGDHVIVHRFEKNANETFPLWFGRVIDGQLFTDLEELSNRFAQPFYQRKDGFVAYHEGDTELYVLVYHPGTTDVPLYPHVMKMIVQSFRPQGVGTFLSEQQVLPSESAVEPFVSSTVSSSTEENIVSDEPIF